MFKTSISYKLKGKKEGGEKKATDNSNVCKFFKPSSITLYIVQNTTLTIGS